MEYTNQSKCARCGRTLGELGLLRVVEWIQDGWLKKLLTCDDCKRDDDIIRAMVFSGSEEE